MILLLDDVMKRKAWKLYNGQQSPTCNRSNKKEIRGRHTASHLRHHRGHQHPTLECLGLSPESTPNFRLTVNAHPGWQYAATQVLESLPPIGKTWVEFWALSSAWLSPMIRVFNSSDKCHGAAKISVCHVSVSRWS